MEPGTMKMSPEREAEKEAAARRGVELGRPGMVVGLGTGSTAAIAIRLIGERVRRDGLDVRGIPTSTRSAELAREVGIPLTDFSQSDRVDLVLDGADEVDPCLRLIKGGGGALLHEKIVAQATGREVIIVDASKPSPRLGTKWALPVEVVVFGWGSQRHFLEKLGAKVTVRRTANAELFRTDEGHLILDANFGPIEDPHALADKLNTRTGIVEHGLFLDITTDLFIASDDGIEHLTRAVPRRA